VRAAKQGVCDVLRSRLVSGRRALLPHHGTVKFHGKLPELSNPYPDRKSASQIMRSQVLRKSLRTGPIASLAVSQW
jgi:hypothetical protein